MNIILWGLLVILLIGYFVVVWKAAQDWRWYNIVAVCITMLLAVAFLFPTAGVLKSRNAWHKLKEELAERAAAVQAEQRILKYGDPNNPEAGEGIVALDQRLAKLGIEAGRRWRNLRLQNAANNTYVLADVQAAPGAAPGIPPDAGAQPAPTEPLIPQELVVYGFAERLDAQQVLLPAIYLGEFRVTASAPNQVTITAIGTLGRFMTIDPQQTQSWSLYELLPLDGHEPFVAEGSVSSEDNYFGRINDALVNQLLTTAGQLVNQPVKPETLQEYLRDGGRANPEDPPPSQWVMIQFTKNHEIVVDSPDEVGALEEGFFDLSGRAWDARLQRAAADDGKVTFKKDDQFLVKREAGDELENEDVATIINDYYLRPLNDYRFVLRRIRLRLAELANRKTELEFEQTVLEEAIQKTEGMIVTNQVVKDKLEQDLAQFQLETVAIKDYTEKLQQNVENVRAEMLRLHQENLILEQQIEQKHLSIERRLDAVTLAE